MSFIYKYAYKGIFFLLYFGDNTVDDLNIFGTSSSYLKSFIDLLVSTQYFKALLLDDDTELRRGSG